MARRDLMDHRFADVPGIQIPRAQFDRSHSLKTAFNSAYLVPIFWDIAYPGETINLNVSAFARLSTPVFPVMHEMYMETFFFSIPIRQLWANFRKFCGEQVDPGDSIAYTIPYIASKAAGYDNETIYDYFGIPTKVAATFNHNALFLRSYYHTINEWFRDQNLQDSLDWDTDDGPDLHTDYTLQKRCKRFDYFTAALPFLQKGTAVSLPLGTSADVHTAAAAAGNIGIYSDAAADHLLMDADAARVDVSASTTDAETNKMYANLTGATAATINELRLAFATQRLLEKDARSGTRYPEIVSSHFGVTFPDLTYRPIYLGGGSQRLDMLPVAQTSSTDGTSPKGDLSAIGSFGLTGHGFVHSFEEHCIVLGLVNVRSELVYQEGLERIMSDSTRYDLYWPAFSHIGEQSILNQEIYIDAATIGAGTHDDVFGYIGRYDHMRYKQSKVTGKMRSNDAASLDSWHLAQEFGAEPTLNSTFITDAPPISRVVADNTEPEFIADFYFDYKHVRPMPVYSVPGLIDHF